MAINHLMPIRWFRKQWLNGFSMTSTAASALTVRLELQRLETRRSTKKVDNVYMMYKVINSPVDTTLPTEMLKPRYRTTGQQSKLHKPHSKTNIHLNSFFSSAIRLWNTVPSDAPAAVSLDAFKHKLGGWDKDANCKLY